MKHDEAGPISAKSLAVSCCTLLHYVLCKNVETYRNCLLQVELPAGGHGLLEAPRSPDTGSVQKPQYTSMLKD